MKRERKISRKIEEINKEIIKEGEKIGKILKIETDSLSLLKQGKRLRARLLLSLKNIKRKKKRTKVGTLIELLHTASLVHDDIIDENTLRRGLPTVNFAFNDKCAVSIGYLLFSHTFMKLLSLKKSILLSFFETIKDMCIGEILEIESAFNNKRTENNYIEVVKLKTGSLFALSCSVNEGRRNKKFKNFGENFGIAFQILDDIEDLIADEAKLGKPIFQDLNGGIYTLPVIYHLPRSNKAKELFTLKTINRSKNKALHYLKKAREEKIENEELLNEIELLEKRINDISLSSSIHLSRKILE